MKPKYVLPFSASDGRRVDMELCCFCQKLKNLKMPGECKHYEDDWILLSNTIWKVSKIYLMILFLN